jgi:hypothetical protein
MNLTETIYQKSSFLSEEQAREVIDFIDFLKTRPAIANKPQNQRQQAIAYLKNTALDWAGKPIVDRDTLYDNARN